MKTIIHKWFWAWDFDKEELWLNEMSAKGLALTSVGYCRYEFVPCKNGEYNYRIELLENMPTHPESVQYIKFMEDSGVEQVGAFIRWVYFRKENDGVPFDLFSDAASKIKHLNRILTLLAILGGINLYNGVYNIFLGLSNMGSVPNLHIGMLVLVLSGFLWFGYYRLWKKKRLLQKESQIFE